MGESRESSVVAMETPEGGQNQPEIASKRIKKEIMEKGEEDGVSSLPDYLLHEILSRLPSTKEAIITGTLSKRWKDLWTSVHTLNFESSAEYDYQAEFRDNPNSRTDFILSVDKTLTQCHQMKLKKFKLRTIYDDQFESQFNKCIHFAISRRVEELNLWLPGIEDDFLLDQSFFSNSCFTDLTLSCCEFNPIGAISWKNLRNLCVSCLQIEEDMIENILSGSSVLETLVLDHCNGFRQLNITSKSVKKLVLSGYMELKFVHNEVVEIKAPNISSLTIQKELELWKLLLLDVTSLVEANLDYRNMNNTETNHEEAEEEMLKGFIINLRHVNNLKIGITCSKVVSRLEAKGYIYPSNVKFLDVASPSYSDTD